MTEHQVFDKIRIQLKLNNPFVLLGIIIFSGLIIRIIFTPFDLPSRSVDAINFILIAISFQDSVENIGGRYFMWSGLLATISYPFHFENYEGYFTILKSSAIVISLISGVVVFLIANEMMNKKYALMVSSLFIFEPNLIENTSFGLSEGFLILMGLISIYFTIQKNIKLLPLAFVFAGLALDIRTNGVIFLGTAFFACFLRFSKKRDILKNITIGLIIFLIVIFPLIIDDTNRLTKDYENFKNSGKDQFTASFESGSFYKENKYVGAIVTELIHIIRISIPYLIFFTILGVISTLTKQTWQIKILYLTIIFSFIIAIPQYTTSVEYRNLFFLIPIFAILSGFGLERVFKSAKYKNYILIIIVGVLIVSSFLFLKDRQPDRELILEKEEFGKYVVKNFEGTVTATNWNFIKHNMPYPQNELKLKLIIPSFSVESKIELIDYIKNNKIDYIIMDNEKDIRFPVFQEIFVNENEFEFLDKVYDSKQINFEKYYAKIFKINYDKLE